MAGLFTDLRAVMADGRTVLATTSDGEIGIWDIRTGRMKYHIASDPFYSFNALALLPSQQAVIAGAVGETLTRWDLTSGCRLDFKGAVAHVQTLLLLEEGRSVLTIAYQGTDRPGRLQLWSLHEHRLIAEVEMEGTEEGRQAVLDGNVVLVSGSKGGLYRFSLRPLALLERVSSSRTSPVLIALERPGQLLVAHRNRRLERRSTGDLQEVVALGRYHSRTVRKAVLQGDVLVCSSGPVVRLWSISQQKTLAEFHADAAITALAVQGDRIAAGEQSGRVHLLRHVRA